MLPCWKTCIGTVFWWSSANYIVLAMSPILPSIISSNFLHRLHLCIYIILTSMNIEGYCFLWMEGFKLTPVWGRHFIGEKKILNTFVMDTIESFFCKLKGSFSCILAGGCNKLLFLTWGVRHCWFLFFCSLEWHLCYMQLDIQFSVVHIDRSTRGQHRCVIMLDVTRSSVSQNSSARLQSKRLPAG